MLQLKTFRSIQFSLFIKTANWSFFYLRTYKKNSTPNINQKLFYPPKSTLPYLWKVNDTASFAPAALKKIITYYQTRQVKCSNELRNWKAASLLIDEQSSRLLFYNRNYQLMDPRTRPAWVYVRNKVKGCLRKEWGIRNN